MVLPKVIGDLHNLTSSSIACRLRSRWAGVDTSFLEDQALSL